VGWVPRWLGRAAGCPTVVPRSCGIIPATDYKRRRGFDTCSKCFDALKAPFEGLIQHVRVAILNSIKFAAQLAVMRPDELLALPAPAKAIDRNLEPALMSLGAQVSRATRLSARIATATPRSSVGLMAQAEPPAAQIINEREFRPEEACTSLGGGIASGDATLMCTIIAQHAAQVLASTETVVETSALFREWDVPNDGGFFVLRATPKREPTPNETLAVLSGESPMAQVASLTCGHVDSSGLWKFVWKYLPGKDRADVDPTRVRIASSAKQLLDRQLERVSSWGCALLDGGGRSGNTLLNISASVWNAAISRAPDRHGASTDFDLVYKLADLLGDSSHTAPPTCATYFEVAKRFLGPCRVVVLEGSTSRGAGPPHRPSDMAASLLQHLNEQREELEGALGIDTPETALMHTDYAAGRATISDSWLRAQGGQNSKRKNMLRGVQLFWERLVAAEKAAQTLVAAVGAAWATEEEEDHGYAAASAAAASASASATSAALTSASAQATLLPPRAGQPLPVAQAVPATGYKRSRAVSFAVEIV